MGTIQSGHNNYVPDSTNYFYSYEVISLGNAIIRNIQFSV
jgi:hypothetical protein